MGFLPACRGCATHGYSRVIIDAGSSVLYVLPFLRLREGLFVCPVFRFNLILINWIFFSRLSGELQEVKHLAK